MSPFQTLHPMDAHFEVKGMALPWAKVSQLVRSYGRPR